MKLTSSEPDLKTLVDRIDQDDIDLQPEFQRQEVWPLVKKKKLIDTILRDWSVPPIHLVATENGKLEVLDGQQRLAAIRDFIHGGFSIDGSVTPFDERIFKLNGCFFADLPASTKRQVEQYPIRVFRLTDYAPDEPSELFYRLNQPTPLTPGEQRNALYGPARQQLKSLVSLLQNKGISRESVGFSNSRMAYDDVLAKFLYFIDTKDISVKSTESVISERFRKQEPFDVSVIQRAEESIHSFIDSVAKHGKQKLNKASLLSWLVFFCRSHVKLPEYSVFFDKFYSSDAAIRAPHRIGDSIALFNDRSSLRVTDVSSVVYRDFCLWYCYSMLISPPKLPDIVERYVTDVKNEVARLPLFNLTDGPFTFEDVLSRNLDISEWGKIP